MSQWHLSQWSSHSKGQNWHFPGQTNYSTVICILSWNKAPGCLPDSRRGFYDLMHCTFNDWALHSHESLAAWCHVMFCSFWCLVVVWMSLAKYHVVRFFLKDGMGLLILWRERGEREDLFFNFSKSNHSQGSRRALCSLQCSLRLCHRDVFHYVISSCI